MKKMIALALLAVGVSTPAHAGPLTITWLISYCHATGGDVTASGSRKVGAVYIPWVTCVH